ncbi:F-box/WD repeat-containing protein 4 [Bicyclus anynana]|uniref:F-box/WD repeat-containing protein 4 n=1 Tax=Bicyclus anynana TaxID=110368 RepID=A0A6J1P3I4_BICAN|nr:F-box/WD repeat-containing protein 4 [Bicyclus anynana]
MCSNFIIHMPYDILINILVHLELRDILNLMLTCKALKKIIINENILWRIKSSSRFILQRNKSKKIQLSWYNRCRVSYNWCKGISKCKDIVQHSENYMPWLQLRNNRTLYLSVGSELRCYTLEKKRLMWSVNVPTVKREDKRTNDISRFLMKENLILCGSRDGSTIVYALDSAHRPLLLMHIKDSHEAGRVEVSAVEKINDCIITASERSPCICLWECRRLPNSFFYNKVLSRKEYRLPDEVGCRCLAVTYAHNKLALGPNGNTRPLLFDTHTGTFLMKSEATRTARDVVRDVQWHDANRVAYVTHSGRLEMIDIRSSEVVYESKDPFQSSLYCLKTDANRAVLCGASEYSRCVLFDERSTRHVQMYFTQKRASPVYSLDFDSTKLIAAADRGVATLNFNVSAAMTPANDYSYVFEHINR